ncbi:unnamed protein product [Musa acuminata subsp. burmannicoides]
MATSDATSSPAGRLGVQSIEQPQSLAASCFGHSSVPFSAGAMQAGVGGRVSRPPRRRMRASRRAPVILLNTDAANFRAMVQHFTGLSSEPYSLANQPGGRSAIKLGPSFHDAVLETMTAYSEKRFQPQWQQQRYPEAMFSLHSNRNSGSDALPQALRHSAMNREMADGLLFAGISSQMTIRPTSLNTRANNISERFNRI